MKRLMTRRLSFNTFKSSQTIAVTNILNKSLALYVTGSRRMILFFASQVAKCREHTIIRIYIKMVDMYIIFVVIVAM